MIFVVVHFIFLSNKIQSLYKLERRIKNFSQVQRVEMLETTYIKMLSLLEEYEVTDSHKRKTLRET